MQIFIKLVQLLAASLRFLVKLVAVGKFTLYEFGVEEIKPYHIRFIYAKAIGIFR